jgi:hypothetical protein
MLKEQATLEKKQAKKAKRATTDKLWLPAIECAAVTGYARGTSVTRLGANGTVKRKKLDDGSFVYDVEAVRAEAAKKANQIGGQAGARKKVMDAMDAQPEPTMYLPAKAAAAAVGCSTSFVWKAVKKKLVRMKGPTTTRDRLYHVGDVRKARLLGRRGMSTVPPTVPPTVAGTDRKVRAATSTPTNGLSAFTEKLAAYHAWAEASANIHMLDAERAAQIMDACDVLAKLVREAS